MVIAFISLVSHHFKMCVTLLHLFHILSTRTWFNLWPRYRHSLFILLITVFVSDGWRWGYCIIGRICNCRVVYVRRHWSTCIKQRYHVRIRVLYLLTSKMGLSGVQSWFGKGQSRSDPIYLLKVDEMLRRRDQCEVIAIRCTKAEYMNVDSYWSILTIAPRSGRTSGTRRI